MLFTFDSVRLIQGLLQHVSSNDSQESLREADTLVGVGTLDFHSESGFELADDRVRNSAGVFLQADQRGVVLGSI